MKELKMKNRVQVFWYQGCRQIALSLIFIAILLSAPVKIKAQGFGFGDDKEAGNSGNAVQSSPLTIGGEVNAELKGFFNDFSAADKLQLGNIFNGKLNFSVSGSSADAVIKLKLAPVFGSPVSPLSIDEAYGRVFFGPVNIEGGLRKLSWGRADSFGPLDVINPLDYSDLSAMGDPQSIKISRPLLHFTWNLNYFSKVEAVFVPWFEGHRFAGAGRWAPEQIASMPSSIAGGLLFQIKYGLLLPFSPLLPIIKPALDNWSNGLDLDNFFTQSYNTFDYAQAGLRFTTSIGPADFGIQYYYGRLPRPAYNIDLTSFVSSFYTLIPSSEIDDVDTSLIKINVAYNPYHQIGVDYAQVIAGFNVRAEAGANITSDLDGTDGSVYNPSLVWSLGFDRDLFWGINLNAQGTGSIILFHDKINSDPLKDTQAGKDLTSTRITMILSKKFLMDQLEIKATGLWGIEDKDFLVMPGITWSHDSVTAGISAGFFLGDIKGELGQYRDNNYLKISLGYQF
ncbi:MAG: hypothetical protein FWD78_09965 [Treponema sp.]|nr:hypothetical protein [Treponema sp.]